MDALDIHEPLLDADEWVCALLGQLEQALLAKIFQDHISASHHWVIVDSTVLATCKALLLLV